MTAEPKKRPAYADDLDGVQVISEADFAAWLAQDDDAQDDDEEETEP